MKDPLRVSLRAVLLNNRRFLRDVFNLSENQFLKEMSTIEPSRAFKAWSKSTQTADSNTRWDSSNPTYGWCAQMTRFLKEYHLIPAGFVAYCDNDKAHYYFINEENEVIDLTIYQARYSNPNELIEYDFNKARFNPVSTTSSKDAMRLYDHFKEYIQPITPHQIRRPATNA